MQKEITLKKELIRKSIHLMTSAVPLAYFYYLNKEQILALSISLFILFLIGDILRINVTELKQIYEKIFGSLLRENESGKKLNGATLLLLGFSLAFFLFDKNIAIIATLFLTVSDSSAAIFGKKFGTHNLWDKSVEGAVAFFLTAFIVCLIFYDHFVISFIIAFIMAIIESAPIKINDNLTIPLVSGGLFTLTHFI
jgi:dolichol kinase